MSYASRRRRATAAPARTATVRASTSSTAYRQLVADVKRRAKRGEGCHFCGGAFDWGLHHNDRWAFTVHHLARLMDGGSPVPQQHGAAPAHRGCNSRDGLGAQNRRRGHPHPPAHITYSDEPTSEDW